MHRPFLKCVSSAVIAVALAAPAMSHHSFSMFDATRTVQVSGTVHDFQWTNPHVWIELKVTDAKGAVTDWSIEAGAPNALTRSGWKRSSIAVGDKVTLTINPLRSGAPGGA